MVKLLILDLNGVLCFKHGKNTKIRENLPEFINWAQEHYDLAIFSSTTEVNVHKILKTIFKNVDYTKIFKFIWCRDRTTKIEGNKFKTAKILKNIWDNPVINGKDLYHENNTLIIDDELIKVQANDPKNYLTDEIVKLDLLNLIPEIELKFAEMEMLSLKI